MGVVTPHARTLARSVTAGHPRLQATIGEVARAAGVPHARAAQMIESVLLGAVEHAGLHHLTEMTKVLRRIETLRGNVAEAVAHVVQNGRLPEGMTHERLGALIDEIGGEMRKMRTPAETARSMAPTSLAERILGGEAPTSPPHPTTEPPKLRPGQAEPAQPGDLAGAMQAARDKHPQGAALVERHMNGPHADELALAILAESDGDQAARLAAFRERANLTDAEANDIAAAVREMSLARDRARRVGPQARMIRERAVAGLPEPLRSAALDDHFILGPRAEMDRKDLLVAYKKWKSKLGREPTAADMGDFRAHLRAEAGSFTRPLIGEHHAVIDFAESPGAAVMKDGGVVDPTAPGGRRVNPREGGTDGLILQENGYLDYFDDKSHRSGGGRTADPMGLSGVSAFEGPRFAENIGDDIAALEQALARQRGAGLTPDPKVGETISRLRALKSELEALALGPPAWSEADYVKPENLRAIRAVLDRNRVRLHVTSVMGDVTRMTARLEGLGIRVHPGMRQGGF